LVGLLLWFAAPLNAQQIVTAIHVQWDNNLNDNQPWQCVTTGEAANPWFHFIVAYKFPIINVMVDWAELQELTQAHPVQPTRQTNFSLQSGLPVGCTRPPVSDPQNWGIRWCGMFPTMGPFLHNAPHRLTVQYRYLAIVGYNPMPVYHTFGPFQTTVEFSVRNLVVSSSDEVKVLKWDPDRPEVCDTTFRYSLDSAQRRDVPVRISIYSTDGAKVYEVTEQKACPQTHTFSWDGQTTSGQPAEPGLYVFDVEVNPNAYPFSDADRLGSGRISIGEHEAFILPSSGDLLLGYASPSQGTLEVSYVLRSDISANRSLIQVYDPDFILTASVEGGTKVVIPQRSPLPEDWNVVNVSCSLNKPKKLYPYTVIIWAWDDIKTYKNHLPKSIFANQSVRAYTCAHFDATGVGTSAPAAKQFRDVRFQTYSVRQGGTRIASVDFGDTWWWYDAANSQPPSPPTNTPRLHRTATALFWDKQLVFRALESVNALTLMAHGRKTAIGTGGIMPSRITVNELWSRYYNNGNGWYYWWSGPSRGWYQALGLGHLRVVAAVGCRTGGVASSPGPHVSPADPEYYTLSSPEAGSIADYLNRLGVRSVVYVAAPAAGHVGGATGRTLVQASKLFLEYFWRYATKGAPDFENPSNPPTYGSVAAAALAAKRYIKRTYRGLTANAVWYQFFVKGDAALYP
jgi:hypothetical protein